MKIRSAVALLLGCAVPALASGCAAGVNPAQSLPALNVPANAGAERAEKQNVRFVVRLPKNKHKGHAPKYVSPATKSMRVLVSLGGKTKVDKAIALTIGSSGCSSTGANAQCIFDVALPPANGYVASFTTYDGLNGTGKILSAAANVVFTVSKGKKTVVGLTLDGVPAGIQIYPDGATAFYAVTYDADGNVIVGPGAPNITASGSGATVAAIGQPTAAQPNVIRLSPIGGASGIETINLTAGYPLGATNGCAVTGAICTLAGAATVTFGQEVFLANYYDTTTSTILGFRVPLTSAAQTPEFTIGVAFPFPIALDSHDNLFVTQYSDPGSLIEYAAPYNAVTARSSGIDDAEALTVSGSGAAFATGNGHVAEYVPPYTAAPTTFASLPSADGIAVDAANNVYLTATTSLAVFAPPYTSASLPKYTVGLASPAQYPVVVSGNKLYVGEESDVQVYSLPITSNNPTPVATLSTGIAYAYGMAVDAAGNLYVANYNGGAASTGNVAIFHAPLSSGESPSATITVNFYPQDIDLDRAGNIYVSTYEGGTNDEGSIQEFAPPFTSASLAAVTISNNVYYPFGLGLVMTKASRFTMRLNR
jgi:hypothetical protein